MTPTLAMLTPFAGLIVFAAINKMKVMIVTGKTNKIFMAYSFNNRSRQIQLLIPGSTNLAHYSLPCK